MSKIVNHRHKKEHEKKARKNVSQIHIRDINMPSWMIHIFMHFINCCTDTMSFAIFLLQSKLYTNSRNMTKRMNDEVIQITHKDKFNENNKFYSRKHFTVFQFTFWLLQHFFLTEIVLRVGKCFVCTCTILENSFPFLSRSQFTSIFSENFFS